MSVEVDRRQVLAYRVQSHELDRAVARPSDLAVLDLGVQDTPVGAARQALVARLDDADLADPALFSGPDPLAAVWSHRGAPHLHRDDDLAGLAKALWPWSDEDARARMGRGARRLADAGLSPLEGLRLTAEAWRSVVAGAPPEGLTKGEISTAVTERLPDGVPEWCRGCGSTHVNDLLFRLGALPGGARVVPGRTPLTFEAVPHWPGVPDTPAGTDRVLGAYLHLLGPATMTEAADFLGTTAKSVRARDGAWPGGLVEVSVEGRPGWLAEADLDALRSAPAPDLVRLVAASDPYLQARHRELLVPDPAHRKALWQILGRPGAVVVDGEVVGIWRAKTTRASKKTSNSSAGSDASSNGHGCLAVTVELFGRLRAGARRALAAEAERLAAVRGLSAATVRAS